MTYSVDADLQQKIQSLELELRKCKARIVELEGRRPHAAGDIGRDYLASLLGVRSKHHNCPHDILTPTNYRLEVKTSKLNRHKHANGGHWGWEKPLGGENDKGYDRLILLAEPDPPHIARYAQPLVRYVIFDIPKLEVPKLLNRCRDISIGSNPDRVFSPTAIALYRDFQITESEFIKTYQTA